ncbi:selenocysteine-specific translation elongation factor [Thermoanaerobacterium sp. DL9XJH110]|uniref:selenocysteine-specific translation elongation factor n=1 Tax=Thermoanaerobacterium sp. DL9XJH110 TaxID=3386643 RepID=UPI003BB6B7F8
MKEIILGTAGHIDHGKTTLIKALTGINTDRLKEEQKRGITIDLGFAHFTLPSGRRVGIVDVPGHEKFIKNMLAGAGGMDMVLMVIAADEGVMPQTREHLNILKLLNVSRGITVITKKDAVDEEWLELVIEEVKEQLKGTFLENAPIIPVSSVTGEGLKELVEAIDKICRVEFPRDLESPFRLPVDRVFTLQGIGTVVTGSLISGTVKVGDDVEIYPMGKKSRVRSIEVHGQSVDFALAGQRTALNLADVKKEDMERGNVIAPPGSLLAVTGAYAYLKLLEEAPKPVKNRERVRFHTGTKEALARLVLMEGEELSPGGESFVLIQLEEPVTCAYKDYFVIRSYSPATTIGGGRILFINPKRLRKGAREKGQAALAAALNGDLEDFITGLVEYFGREYMSLQEIRPYTAKSEKQVERAAKKLAGENKTVMINASGEKLIFSRAFYDTLTKEALAMVEDYHKKFPLSEGIPKEEFRSRINLEPKIFEALLENWINEGGLESAGNAVKRKGFSIQLSEGQYEVYEKIQELFRQGGWTPPTLDEVLAAFPQKREKQVKEVLFMLCNEGRLVKLSEEIFMSEEWIERALHLLQQFFVKNKELTVSAFRDMLGTSRKYALPLLEYMDSIKATRRVKNVRIAGSNLYG